MKRFAASAGFGFVALGLSPALADTTYQFTPILDPTDTSFTQLLGVNDAGVIAGYFGSGAVDRPNRGFTLVLPNIFAAENVPNAAQTQVIGIDTAGGTDGFFIDNNGITHGFVEANNDFSTVDFPGTSFNQLLGLNDLGEAAGFFQDSGGVSHGYTVKDGVFTQIALPGAVSTQATGVNNSGEISGFNQTSSSTADGFVIAGGAVTTLDFPGATVTQALGINNAGQVVGAYVDANGDSHGFLYTRGTGTYQSIDEPNGVGATIVNGINDQGEIVGFYVLASTGATIGFTGTPVSVTAPDLVASVLPGARSVEVGNPATIFATAVNTTGSSLSDCQVALPASAPADLSLGFQTTDPATNMLTGTANAPVTIGANGSQSFLLSFTSTAALNSLATPISFTCTTDDASAALVPGVDTVDLVFSATPIADVIALSATPTGNGIVTVPQSLNQPAAFAVASINAGTAATLTVSADTGDSTLPLDLNICATDASTGQCLAPPASTVTTEFAANATPTFSVFIDATAPVVFAPATARIFVRFTDAAGVSHGSTSVAVDTN